MFCFTVSCSERVQKEHNTGHRATYGNQLLINDIFVYVYVPIRSSKLLCLNLILFCSKSCKLKTFPAVISRVFLFVMNGPSQKAVDVKWSPLSLMLPISSTFCHVVIVKSYCLLWQKKQ